MRDRHVMPTAGTRLQRIVKAVENGEIQFHVPADPHWIVVGKGGYDLQRQDSAVDSSVSQISMGYRYTPTHGEWALMLRPHAQ